MTKIICVNLNGICKYKHVLEIGKIYYTTSSGIFHDTTAGGIFHDKNGIFHDKNVEYYYLSEKYNGDICGYFDISMFMNLAEYREKQINSILED